MSSCITVTYSLNPPDGSKPPSEGKTSKVYQFPLIHGASSSRKQQEYYNILRATILEAKAKIGEDLTLWRDAVGTLDDKKEPKKGKTDGDSETEEDEELS